MKKFNLLFSFLLCLCLNFNLSAQVATVYTFTDSLGTYNPIVGDTIVALATHTSTDPFQLNDVNYGPNRIPFIFTFNGYDYNEFNINSNGFITFGNTIPGPANYGPISSSEAYKGAISGFGLDLIGLFGTTVNFVSTTFTLTNVANFRGVEVGRHITAATGIKADTYITAFDTTLRTITISKPTDDIIATGLVIQIAAGSIVRSTEGTAPFRVHTIQFKNFRQYLIIGTNDNFNFQIKLFETTGVIHVVYGNMQEVTSAGIFGQTGLRGDAETDFNNRTNTGSLNWGSSFAGGTNAVTSLLSSSVYPVSGQTYIWTPDPLTLPVELASFTSSVNEGTVNLNWTTASEINNSGFVIERSSGNDQWVNAGFVKGNGTTLSSMNYNFADRNVNTGVYSYRLKQLDYNGNFEYFNLSNEVNIGVPSVFHLSQNYPNPFNPSTKIDYSLPFDGNVKLTLFDISGRVLETLVNDVRSAGYYTVNFNASDLSSGVYFYRLTLTGNKQNYSATGKMTLLK